MRLAACLGVGLDVIEPCAFPLDDRRLRRAALDYAPLAEARRHDGFDAFLDRRRAEGGRVVLLTTRAPGSYLDFAFRADDLLLLGSESRGAPPEVHAAADARIRIPIRPGARSLNVVAAAAIAAAEALRQTGQS